MNQIPVKFVEFDPNIDLLADKAWHKIEPLQISKYWSGHQAPTEHHFDVRLAYTNDHLIARFDHAIPKDPIINDSPDTSAKTIGLWERDVCEIFIAPDRDEPRKYFEFEVAQTGEWLDLSIDTTRGERITDWDYGSEMITSARTADEQVTMTIAIPWSAFGKRPQAGDIWLGNIFRCVGAEPDRGYLAWQPTMTEKPNFHVPAAFGKLFFAHK